MDMVFCRGCGKTIHVSAGTCPSCGAVQVAVAASKPSRNIGRLIGWGSIWTLIFWIGSLMVVGVVASILHPENAAEAGSRAGEAFGSLLLIISLGLSISLTIVGKLPGTTERKALR